MTPEERKDEEAEGVKVFFNPFAFTVEENNEFIRKGYEVVPLRVPKEAGDE